MAPSPDTVLAAGKSGTQPTVSHHSLAMTVHVWSTVTFFKLPDRRKSVGVEVKQG